jgi:two-component system OmpR family sensor kinase
MFSSLRFRLWLTYVFLVGIVIVIAGTTVVVYIFRNPASDRRELQRLRVITGFLMQRSAVFDLLPNGSIVEGFEKAASRIDNQLGVRVAVFDGTGQLLVDSRADQAPPLPSLGDITRPRVRETPIFQDISRRQWIYTLTPLEGNHYLLLAAPRLRTPFLAILRDEFLTPFIRGGVLALVLSLLMALWISRWISAPLKRMSVAAGSLSNQDFHRIRLEGPKEVKDLARALNDMGERVHASQRSQRDFIANVSHDLKTPLTSIQGFAQAIMDGTTADPEASKQAAGVIYAESERMYRMVLDLLELARFDSGLTKIERSPLDLNELLNGLVVKFLPIANQAKVNLEFIGADPLRYPKEGNSAEGIKVSNPTVIIGDADRLAQVFTNLVENAVKFTPPGGRVQIRSHSQDGWVEVQVSDTGPGIPPDELERIFERFYQTDKSRQGGKHRSMGLGLAIAQEIVQAHGGTIRAFNRTTEPIQGSAGILEPSSGTGSDFVVRLPVVRPDDTTLIRRRKSQPGGK